MSVLVDRVVLAGDLTPDEVCAIASGAAIQLAPDALDRVAANRAALERLVAAGEPIYGITTGFGALVSERVEPAFHRTLQVNLLRSHACGTGEDLPREVVRAALAIRLNGLLLAHSGIRPLVLERVAALLNAGFVPSVPRTGSLGASGDLAPSAHAFLPLIGEGEVVDRDGATLSGAEALARLGVEPLELESKEGLALINGTHFMAAVAALLSVRVGRLLDSIDLVAAATIDALRGSQRAFDPRVHALRPIAGQVQSAQRIAAAALDRVASAATAGCRTPTRCAAPRRCTARRARRTSSLLASPRSTSTP